MLAHANLPLKFWNEAFRTSIYLINRLPTIVLKSKTPIEALFHVKHDYSVLRTLGCTCYPNIWSYNCHKLQSKFTQCIFLGYDLNNKGYKCLDPTNRTYISKYVIFYEYLFPSMTTATPFSKPTITAATFEDFFQPSAIIPQVPHVVPLTPASMVVAPPTQYFLG